MRMARQVLGGVFPSLRASKDLSEDMDRILGTVRVNRKGNLIGLTGIDLDYLDVFLGPGHGAARAPILPTIYE